MIVLEVEFTFEKDANGNTVVPAVQSNLKIEGYDCLYLLFSDLTSPTFLDYFLREFRKSDFDWSGNMGSAKSVGSETVKVFNGHGDYRKVSRIQLERVLEDWIDFCQHRKPSKATYI